MQGGLGGGRLRAGASDMVAGVATWDWVKEQTVTAVEATIARHEQNADLVAATNQANQLPPAGKSWLAFRTVAAPRAGWADQTFYVIDAEESEASRPAMHRVHVKYPPTERRVVIEVTAELRAALASVRRVRLMFLDPQKLELLRQLRSALGTATRGPRLLELWSTDRLPVAGPVAGLNDGQSQAFAAMTSEGGSLVWGPPGTGKPP